MHTFLIEFEHDSKFLGHNGYGNLLISAETFEGACEQVPKFRSQCINEATGYTWQEPFKNPRNFQNLTII